MLRRCQYRRLYCTINVKKIEKPDLNGDKPSQINNIISEKGVVQNVEKESNLNKMENVEKSALAAIDKQRQQYDDVKAQIRETVKRMFNKWQTNVTAAYPENDVNLVSGQTEQIFKRIMNNIEEITHMKEVRLSQDHVREVRTRLLAKSNEKRCLLKALDDVRTELGNIYRDMKATNSRSPEKYLELTRQEIELIQKEKQLMDKFAIIDDEEQRILNYELSAAINDSYEKEKNHTNFIKILGFMGALVGSFLTLLGALVSYMYQQNRYNTMLKELDVIVGQKLSEPMNSVHLLLKRLDEKRENKPESWGSYIKRHTSWTYSWAWRKS